MKNAFKFLCLSLVISLFAASCNNTTSVDTASDTTNGVIDSMPVDTTASGDTAVVIDTIQ